MRPQPRARHLALTATLVVLVSACVTDRSAELGAECAASTDVATALIASGGAPSDDPAMERSFDALATSWTAAADIVAELDPLLARAGSLTAEERDVWTAGLEQLDGLVGDRCGFSMRVLVAAEAAEDAPTPAPVSGDVVEDAGEERPLDFASLVGRVPDADWAERGYRGIVGLGPGVYVTVFGVESGEAAVSVCEDLVSALAEETRTSEVVVEVQGLGDSVLAQSAAGDCFLLM